MQLAESAMKLDKLYRAARNAPHTIARLVHDLETMAIALHQLEEDRQRTGDNGLFLMRCITACQHSIAQVKQLVDKMERCLKDHVKIGGRAYIAFEERDVRELLDDLEKTKSSLQLTYTMFLVDSHRRSAAALEMRLAGNTHTVQQLELSVRSTIPQPRHQGFISDVHAAIVNEPSETRIHNLDLVKTVKSNDDIAHRTQVSPLRHTKRKSSKMQSRIKFRLPLWLCTRVWDLAITKAQCSWSMHLRTYNFVSSDSLIIHYCTSGNLAGVRRLIESGEGLPLDVDGSNNRQWNLIEVRHKADRTFITNDN